MNTLGKLIAKHCPDGVEYKPLGEVCEIQRGERITKSELKDEGAYEVISGGIGALGRYDRYNRSGGTITIAQYGTAGYVAWRETCFWANDVCYTILTADNLQSRYIYFVLKSIQELIYAKVRRDAIPAHLPRKALEDLEIPIPPLPVQKEIVRMLDDMAGLIDALEEELAARKKQYEWCRERLLTFGDDVEWTTLGEISTAFFRGSGILRTQVTATGVPCVRYGEIYTSYDIWFNNCVSHTRLEFITSPKFFECGDILFAITGEKIEEIGKAIAYVGNDRCIAGGDTAVMKHTQNAKYIAYVLSTTAVQNQKSRGKVKSKVVHLSVPQLKAIKIPLPNPSVQEKIVRKLDDITELIAALEEELALRKQQYEYYRDKLLAFKRKPEVA